MYHFSPYADTLFCTCKAQTSLRARHVTPHLGVDFTSEASLPWWPGSPRWPLRERVADVLAGSVGVKNNGFRRIGPGSSFIAATLIEVFCEEIDKLVVL